MGELFYYLSDVQEWRFGGLHVFLTVLLLLHSGSGEFLLVEEDKPEDILLVVRTINSSAFSQEDWNEFVVDVSIPWVLVSRSMTTTADK